MTGDVGMGLSPDWSHVMPPGPDTRGKITVEYANHVARDAYLWAWPLVNMYNRRLFFATVKEMLYAGALPQAPLNTFAMLTDYIVPEQRHVACPNQDVVYGAGFAALDVSPVVVQVPDFGDRFWVYQIVDQRTDAFAQIGKMYGTTPGFYLLVGPNWKDESPKGITQTFRCSTSTAFVGPRVFQDDTADDKQAIQAVLQHVVMYPLDEYDGTFKSIDWHSLPRVDADPGGPRETQWVLPDKFFDELPAVLASAPAARRGSALRPSAGRGAGSPERPNVEASLDRRREGSGRGAGGPTVRIPQLRYPAARKLVHHRQRRRIRHRLLHSHCRRQVQHSRQRAYPSEILLPGPRRGRTPAQRIETVCRHVRQRPDPTSPWFLVSDHVQPVPLLRPQRHPALLGWHEEQGTNDRSGRLADDLRSSGSPAQCSTHQLAPSTERRRLLAVHAGLLAEAGGA
jgi:hypothetical protein